MSRELREQIEKVIYEAFDSLTLNNFATLGNPEEPIWEKPLIGVAAGDDEYYDFLKEHIGDFHWTPDEVFRLKYGQQVERSKLRVLSLIFPQTEATKKMQMEEASVFPCDRWVVSRGEWEPLMREFAPLVEEKLAKLGIRTAALDLIKEFSRETSPSLGIASRWSHRHSAYAAGLGTFGLSDGFISEKGKAIRITSVIIEADIPVDSREGRGPYDWCLYYADGSCGACINRCPIGAITGEGHDKESCMAYEDEAVAAYWPKHIERGDYIFGCGICQAGVPCMSRRPVCK